MPYWAHVFQNWPYNAFAIMYQIIYGYARLLQFLQEPKSLSCLGHNSVNMIMPLQRRIDHNAQQLVSRDAFNSSWDWQRRHILLTEWSDNHFFCFLGIDVHMICWDHSTYFGTQLPLRPLDQGFYCWLQVWGSTRTSYHCLWHCRIINKFMR